MALSAQTRYLLHSYKLIWGRYSDCNIHIHACKLYVGICITASSLKNTTGSTFLIKSSIIPHSNFFFHFLYILWFYFRELGRCIMKNTSKLKSSLVSYTVWLHTSFVFFCTDDYQELLDHPITVRILSNVT